MVAGRIAVLVKGYPRLSETFIAQEILGLEQRGLELLIVSLRQPTDQHVHEMHRQIRAPVLYLPEYAHDDRRRVLRGLGRSLLRPGFWPALASFLADLARDPTRNRMRRFAQALVLTAELPADVGHLHAHFLHTPTSVARYTALIRRLPFTVSAHAKDIWTTPLWEKRQKLRDARWLVTCTRANLDHLRAIAPEAALDLVYHGLDGARFPPPARPPGADGGDPARPVLIATVARAVEKKGLDTLVQALALLPADLHWRFEHVGGGALTRPLQAEAQKLGIGARITWHGAKPQEAVLALLRRADLFCLPARIGSDGDRDGLPNVLMEALSQDLAAVTTPVSAIPELVEDGITGRLVPPDDPTALAAALAALIRDPALRQRLGRAGRERVAEDFVMDPGLDRLAARLAPTPALRSGTCASLSMRR